MKENSYDIIVGKYIEVYKPSYTGFQDWSNKSTSNNFARLDFVISGQMTVTCDGKTFIVSKNQMLILPKNKIYSIKVFGNFSYYSILFDYETENEDNSFPFPLCFETENTDYFIDKYKAAYNLSAVEPYGYKVKIREILYDIIAKISEENYTKNFFNKICYSIRKSVKYIDVNYSDPEISLKVIADQSGITDTHFRRIFKQFYGVTPITYITDLRLKKSKNLLSTTNLSVEEISKRCGFNEYTYFTKLFKKHIGESPKKWRDENKTKDIV